MKEMLKTVLRVISVHKTISFILIIFFISCAIKKNTKKITSNYSINKFKTSSNKSITIHTFDKELCDTITKPLILFNNLYFGNTNIFRPGKGKHNIEIFFVGKASVEIENLNVEKGDSIIINAYLKEDNILYD